MNEIIVKHSKIFKPLDKPYRYKVMYGGRGGMKSWVVARKLLINAMNSPMRILCTRELQKSIKQSVHKLLSIQIDKLGLGAFYRITNEGIYGINGTEFIFMGIKYNSEEIKSTEAIDVCWIEEAHSMTEVSWDLIDPTIRKQGSEIWITYNTRFKYDHVHLTFVVNKPPPNSLIIKVNYSDNQYLPDVLRAQAENMKEVDYDKYLNIWLGEVKSLASGAIFGAQITKVRRSNRLTYIPIEQNCQTYTFMDLGKSDETAIWFMQRVGTEYRFIDYFEGRLEEVSYYSKFVMGQDLSYARHYLPHDADHERLGMTRNIKVQFKDGGLRPISVVPKISDKSTAIELAREVMPKCWFHIADDENRPDDQCEGYVSWVSDDRMKTRAKRAEVGFENLCNYRYKYNDDDKVYKASPHHDKASNGADAFMTFAQCNIATAHEDKYSDWSKPVNG